MTSKVVLATNALDTITWLATHKPLLDLSLMLTEYLANQMMSKSSKSWLKMLGWNPDVNVGDICSEAFQYEKELLFGRRTPPIESVVSVLSQVNSLVAGTTAAKLPAGINIAHILGSMHSNASLLAGLPANLDTTEKKTILRVIEEARKINATSLTEKQLEQLPAKAKEWVRLGFNDLVTSTPSLDQIQVVYDKWRKWGQTHENTVWNALLAGGLEESQHWGKLAGIDKYVSSDNKVLKYLRTAVHTLEDDWDIGKQSVNGLIEKSRLHAAASKPQPKPEPNSEPKMQRKSASTAY